MQVKKFEAPTIAEALNLVKAELGPEAIILSTKNHRKGFGLLSKASVEVTAAVSDKSLAKKQITEKVVPAPTKEQIAKLSAQKQAEIYDEFTGHYHKKRDERLGAKAQPQHQQSRATQAAASSQQRQPPGGRLDRSGTAALLGQAPSETTQFRVSGGGGAFGAAASASTASSPGRVGPPRYIDIPDDDEDGDAGSDAAPAYGRNGRMSAKNFDGAADVTSSDGGKRAPAAGSSYDSERMAQNAARAAEKIRAKETAAWVETRSSAPAAHETVITSLKDDVEKLKAMLEELKIEQMTLSDVRIPEATSDELQAEFNNLLRNGLDKKFATALAKQVAATLPREALRSSEKITETIAVEMMNNLKVDHPLDFKAGQERRVFALIGPTGVGKTTTVAKLASQAILQKNLRVGLINVDSYKVAALDQLATYAKILNVPFRSATNAVELDRALQEFRPLDLVLIDTSGSSQRDSESLAQIKQLLGECAAVRPLLIMSATTRDQELYDIVTRFKIFNPCGLLFSKLDETSTFGCIYNVAVKTGLPLGYFTVGQRVPEDIEPASRERVADLILDL